MVAVVTWCRYFAQRFNFCLSIVRENNEHNLIRNSEMLGAFGSYLFRTRLTFLYFDKAEDKSGMLNGTLLVRKIPERDAGRVRVGDIIVMHHPWNSEGTLVRRVTGVGGYLMESTDESEVSFILNQNEWWVNTDDKKPKETFDSRTFGPVGTRCVIGRVMYCLRSSTDHEPVNNSPDSIKEDAPILEVELDIDEMKKYHEENTKLRLADEAMSSS